ncbi:hypothetical protein Pcinc_025130 [Petrolisthes cinctipes]|uniref:Uncharacterized protein n=1 Tax=Petrolisthes cinctipes TaxID=88211 RepID=A0AAE1F936_PETCI|nr:hypothetical protein Pcinc_025130 [Petrolisthes cinctipes]
MQTAVVKAPKENASGVPPSGETEVPLQLVSRPIDPRSPDWSGGSASSRQTIIPRREVISREKGNTKANEPEGHKEAGQRDEDNYRLGPALDGLDTNGRQWEMMASLNSDVISQGSSNTGRTGHSSDTADRPKFDEVISMMQYGSEHLLKFSGGSCSEYWKFKGAFENYVDNRALNYEAFVHTCCSQCILVTPNSKR